MVAGEFLLSAVQNSSSSRLQLQGMREHPGCRVCQALPPCLLLLQGAMQSGGRQRCGYQASVLERQSVLS